jgi:exopolysaccharide/PEP-CTERM locus tyrosine autokinase
MGKFFEALRKSEATKGQAASRPTPKKVINKVSAETVEALKLYTTVRQEPTEELTFSRDEIDPRLVCFLEPKSLAAESFRILRAKILTRSLESRPRTIMVTSPQPLDGKTMVAANLAISIAQGVNEHVMLVDCDLRKPSLNRFLGQNAHGGLGEYLHDGTSVAPYLVKTDVTKLTLLPAGKANSNPSGVLSSEKMRRLIEEIKGRYKDRYIIFDATPAQFAAETTFLASMVDGVLLVVRSGKTAKDQIVKTIENIDRNKMIGVVFNASNQAIKDYRYYYQYYQSK